NIETDQAIFNIIHENHYFSPELSAFNVKCDFYFQAIFNKLLNNNLGEKLFTVCFDYKCSNFNLNNRSAIITKNNNNHIVKAQ
ncbi:hypothetical protein, partial [Ketobacter nezhaii]|uniref:hypothetical protein n=1 Tax=Ketobacter sp. MCCC 1A13808 TaxID=2602738 RepID=UPI001E4EAFF8